MSGPVDLAPEDDAPHAPGDASGWAESWYVDFSDPSGRGGYLRLTRDPGARSVWVWAAWVDGGRAVSVRDHDVPPPRGAGLEVRGSGLWVDLVQETPLSHWTFGLEAFGVSFEQPTEAFGDERGDRVALGFDLEWEALEPPFEYPGVTAREAAGHFQHAGRVHGEVLVGSETVSFDGWGQRDRFWGVRDWWDVGWHWAAFRLADAVTVSVARPDRTGSEHATGYVAVEGADPHPIVRASVDTEWGADGLPLGATYEIEGGVSVTSEVVGSAPVLIPSPSGDRSARLPRALCRFTDSDGRTGTGWAEWLQT